jgi:hypothetical protein
LESPEIQNISDKALYLGRRLMLKDGKKYNSGGSGYILNREALNILADEIERDNPSCDPYAVTSAEDILVMECLLQAGVRPHDTRDSLLRERFHVYSPGYSLIFPQARFDSKGEIYKFASPDLQYGFNCCSAKSVSFHYIRPRAMQRIHAYIHQCQDRVPSLSYPVLSIDHFIQHCTNISKEYNVIAKQSWGNLPENLRHLWIKSHCDMIMIGHVNFGKI